MAHNSPFVFGATPGYHPSTQAPQQQRHQMPSDVNRAAPPPVVAAAAAQQAAFQQNAQLPPLSSDVLANISPAQLMEIARLIQVGALQVPPPPGEASAPSAAIEPVGPPQIRSAVQTSDTDKEEGEVEEGEVNDTPEPRNFLRPPPTGPRNRSNSPRGPLPRAVIPKGPVKDIALDSPFKRTSPLQPVSSALSAPRKNSTAHERQPFNKGAAAKDFIQQIIRAGKTFDDIASEVTNPQALAKIFIDLKLPIDVSQEAHLPMHRQVVDVLETTPSAIQKPAAEEQRKTSVTKRPPPPKDRNEYLARLQAAKNKKPEPVPVAGTPIAEPSSATVAVPNVAPPLSNNQESVVPTPASIDSPAPKPTPKRNPIQTHLVRQRLDALKAEQAAKQTASTVPSMLPVRSSPTPTRNPCSEISSSPAPSTISNTLGSGIAEIGARFASLRSQQSSVQPQTIITPQYAPSPSGIPQPPTPTSANGGLPGLFLGFVPTPIAPPQSFVPSLPENRTASQPVPAPAVSSQSSFSLSRKRPVAADFDDYPESTPVTKKPFGTSRNVSDEDDSLIIEVSDDEDDDEMDTEESAGETTDGASAQGLHDLPSTTTFRQPSAPVTPGSMTPGGHSIELKQQQIDEMRRKIQEKMAKMRASSRPATGHTTTVAAETLAVETPSEPSASAVNGTTDASFTVPDLQSTPKAGDVNTGTAVATTVAPVMSPGVAVSTPTRSLSNDRPLSAAMLARQQEKERLRQRLLELERDEAVRSTGSTAQGTPDVSSPAVRLTEETRVQDFTQHEYGAAADAVILDAVINTSGIGSPTSQAQVLASESASAATTDNAIELLSQQARGQDMEDDACVKSPLEDGELSDGSMDKFYEDEPEQSESVAAPSAEISAGQSDLSKEVEANDEERNDSAESTTSGEDMEIEDEAAASGIGTVLDGDDLTLSSPERADDDDNDLFDPNEPLTLSSPQPPSTSYNLDVTTSHPDAGIAEDSETAIDHSGQDTGNGISTGSDDSDDSDDYEPDAAAPVEMEIAEAGKTASLAASPAGAGPADQQAKNPHPSNDFEIRSPPSDPQQSPNAPHPKQKQYYTPYASILQHFRDYRWHPQYLAKVPGGFKSMTFIHQIDPENPFCPFEAADGKCNVPKCAYQHWPDVALTDSDIVGILATKNTPARTTAELERWNAGLAAVVAELRVKGVATMTAIAERVADFRREFLKERGEEGRVVLWGGE